MAFPQSYPKFRHILADGTPAVGYKLYSYLAGTTTAEPTYTDQTEATANANPTILDANGEAAVWLKPTTAYKLVLKTDVDVVVWTVDAIETREGGYFTTINVSGLATMAAITASGQITSTVADGTAPLVITSTTKITNLNADKLDGGDWAAPGQTIGSTTPVDGSFNALTSAGIRTHNLSGNDILQVPSTLGKWIRGHLSEQITLNTGGTTTDSTANLLPADSIIEAVVATVTVSIAVATDWKVGDAAQAARFLAAQTNMVQGASAVGLAHRDPTVASSNLGPVQSAAAKLRITTTGTPTGGKIRVTVFYSQFVANIN